MNDQATCSPIDRFSLLDVQDWLDKAIDRDAKAELMI
jgi:S-adenosylmethionine:diacylglycerol 3-amino-3-carboxypropyl transferase